MIGRQPETEIKEPTKPMWPVIITVVIIIPLLVIAWMKVRSR